MKLKKYFPLMMALNTTVPAIADTLNLDVGSASQNVYERLVIPSLENTQSCVTAATNNLNSQLLARYPIQSFDLANGTCTSKIGVVDEIVCRRSDSKGSTWKCWVHQVSLPRG